MIQYRQKERNPVQKGQNRRKGEEEWITEKSSMRHWSICFTRYKTGRRGDHHRGFQGSDEQRYAHHRSRRPGGRQYVIDRGKARHHGRIADNVDEQSGEKGYTERERSEKDRRIVYIHLTGKGRQAFHHHAKFHEQMTDAVMAELGEEEVQVLGKTLKALTDFFRSYKK